MDNADAMLRCMASEHHNSSLDGSPEHWVYRFEPMFAVGSPTASGLVISCTSPLPIDAGDTFSLLLAPRAAEVSA